MRTTFTAFVFGVLATVLVGALALRVYQWKTYIDKRAFYADAAGSYLFGPSGVIAPDGTEITRQQLIDAYMHTVVEKTPGFHFTPQKGQ